MDEERFVVRTLTSGGGSYKINLPKQFTDALGWRLGDKIAVILDEGNRAIILKKVKK